MGTHMASYDALMKIVLIGDSGVGKSCLIRQYIDSDFEHGGMSTIGVDFRIDLITHQSQLLKLQLWDTAGQERFRSMTGGYYKMSDAIILTYDVTDAKSLQSVEEKWWPEVMRLAPSSLCDERNVLLLGTKSDLGPDRETVTAAEAFAGSIGCTHAVCSSLTGEGCKDAIEGFVHKVADTDCFHEHASCRSAALHEDTLAPAKETTSSNFGCFDRMLTSLRCFQAAVH